MALGKGLGSLIPQSSPRKTIHHETAVSQPVANVSTRTDSSSQERLWHIPLSEITPNAEQPRKHFSHAELEDLVATIKRYGILQPLTVTEREDGGFELIAGERRLRAAQIAGLATVPALVRSATQQEKLELAIIENTQRQDLNPIEEAFSYRRLLEEFHLTQQEVADKVGKSRPYVANLVRLLDLPDPIQKALIDGTLSAGKARAILSLNSKEEQLAMFDSMMGASLSVRDVEQAVRLKGEKSRKGSVRRDPNVMAQEQILEERLGTKVRIAQKGDKGTITIEFHSREELKRLLQELS